MMAEVEIIEKLAQKRILFVINSNSGGGVEQLAASLQADHALAKADLKTCYLYGNSALSKGQKIAALWQSLKQIITFKPDMVITFQPSSAIIAVLGGRLGGCKIHIAHQSNLPALSAAAPRLLDRLIGWSGLYSTIIMNSKATQQAFQAYPRRYRQHLRFIPHGIDWRAPANSKAEIRNSFDLPAQAKILFCCARLSKEKSLHTVIDALPDVPEALFIMAGNGSEQQNLENRAQDLGVLERVHFLGHVSQDQLFALHKAADLFVFPSLTETFGMAVLEAAMSGLPVIVSDIAPLHEVLSFKGEEEQEEAQGSQCAVFVPDWQPKSWSKAINQALTDEALTTQAQRLSPNLRKFYSTEKMLKNYHQLYKDVL